jgi:anti-anti-sigma factor
MSSAPGSRNGLRWTLSVEQRRVDDVLLIEPHGRMSSETSPQLTEALSIAIAHGESRLIVDLAGVDYVSSAGLIALDALSGRVALSGGRLVLCGLSDPVRLVFDLADLLSLFTVVSDRNAALELFGAGR